MIETTVLDYLNQKLPVPVYMEIPDDIPDRFVVLRKSGSGRINRVDTSMFVVRSYAESMLEASMLNEQVKAAMDALPELDAVSASRLTGDYPFPDTTIERYRYQAVYDVTHY